MGILRSVLQMICFVVVGIALTTAGATTSTWQYWIVLLMMLVVSLLPLME